MTFLALVTGTSRGLGAAIAAALLRRGWRVEGCARGPLAAELAEAAASGRLAHARFDLADEDARAAWCDAALAPARLRGVTRVALVNNAGLLGGSRPLQETEAAEIDRVVRTNLVAPLDLTARALRATQGLALRIVDLSSGAATSPYPGWSLYCATKAALRMADLVLAAELGEVASLAGRDVRVLSFAPGVVATRMQEEIRAADPAGFPRRARFEELHRSGALADPRAPAEELAELLEQDQLSRHAELRARAPR